MNALLDLSQAGFPLRLRLDIAYEGGGFHGWARQHSLRTVQGVLEDALRTITHPAGEEDPPRLTVAGRTDAGVHASGQVAHVDLGSEHVAALARAQRGTFAENFDIAAALQHRLSGLLGVYSDVVVSGVSVAPAGFDARFGALWRRYRYRVADGPYGRDPLQRHRTAWVSHPLDVDVMDVACRALVGLHDFATFCKPREGATTIRTLQQFSWVRDGDGVAVASIVADAFCHSMVRALVGGAVAVGAGKLSADDLVLLRDAFERTSAFRVMPAHGLTLEEVGYPPDSGLAQRAERTRARRSLDPLS